MDNFDFKKELLLFLYENNSHSVEIHSICENPALTNYIIKSTIKNIKKDRLIDTDESYRLIGGGDPNKLATVKSLHVKARITPHGEQYVRNTYMKKNDKPQINVTNSVFAGGDINAPISQTNDHSSSSSSSSSSELSATITATVAPTKTGKKSKKILDNKYIVTIISGVIVLIIGYYIMKWIGIN